MTEENDTARRPTTSGDGVRGTRWVFAMTVLLLTGLFVFGINFRVERSFLIEAKTSGITIVFRGIGNAWNFAEASLCTPRPVPDLRRGEFGTGLCGLDLYSEQRLSDEIIDWPNGARVDVYLDLDGTFVVELLSPVGDRPAGSLIVLPRHVWSSQGALTFRGELTIGEVMASGARHFLQDGRWEAREQGWATSVLRGVTQIVKEGTLALGAEVVVIEDDAPSVMFGHVTPNDDDMPSMDLTAISQTGDTALQLSHFGFEKPSVIRPDWIDTALASPFLLALVALLGLLSSLIQVLRELVFAERRNAASMSGEGKRG